MGRANASQRDAATQRGDRPAIVDISRLDVNRMDSLPAVIAVAWLASHGFLYSYLISSCSYALWPVITGGASRYHISRCRICLLRDATRGNARKQRVMRNDAALWTLNYGCQRYTWRVKQHRLILWNKVGNDVSIRATGYNVRERTLR